MALVRTANLIGSDKVEGTAVYAADSQKWARSNRRLIVKVGGKVSYAVLISAG